MTEERHSSQWLTAYRPDVTRRTEIQPTERVTTLDRWILDAVQRQMQPAPVRFVLWDGSESRIRPPDPVGRVIVRDRAMLAAIVWNADLYLGEGYTSGRVEVEGDLVTVLEAVDRATLDRRRGRRDWPWPALVGRVNSLSRSRENIHHHYDIGNAFYKLWLDEDLLYTCAYFPTPGLDLESAQRAKMEHVCRKIALQPGETVAEAGCGWGTLALYMAARHGVTVKAFNISHEQITYARERAARAGLASRVEFIEDDYRNIRGTFDAFVSVGMLEHVGLAHYNELGTLIDRCLDRDHGRGLLHFIGRNRRGTLNPWIRRRIFPGAYPPTLREVTGQVLEPWDLSVLDVENLRLHYAKTLHHWRTRFEAASGEIADMFDESFVRAWRLYLAGSEAAFSTGWMQLFQVTFARGTNNRIPWTRAATTDIPPA